MLVNLFDSPYFQYCYFRCSICMYFLEFRCRHCWVPATVKPSMGKQKLQKNIEYIFKICSLIYSSVHIFNIVIFDVQYLFPGISMSTLLLPQYGKNCRKTSKRKSNNLSPRIAIERGLEDQIPQHRNMSFQFFHNINCRHIKYHRE